MVRLGHPGDSQLSLLADNTSLLGSSAVFNSGKIVWLRFWIICRICVIWAGTGTTWLHRKHQLDEVINATGKNTIKQEQCGLHCCFNFHTNLLADYLKPPHLCHRCFGRLLMRRLIRSDRPETSAFSEELIMTINADIQERDSCSTISRWKHRRTSNFGLRGWNNEVECLAKERQSKKSVFSKSSFCSWRLRNWSRTAAISFPHHRWVGPWRCHPKNPSHLTSPSAALRTKFAVGPLEAPKLAQPGGRRDVSPDILLRRSASTCHQLVFDWCWLN